MLLDTSVLLELLMKPMDHPLHQRILAVVGDNTMHVSPIHFGELADAARRRGMPPGTDVERALRFVDLIPLDLDIAVAGSAIKAEARKRKSGRDFSLIDGIGLATARSRGMPMITMDHEFDGFDDVTVIDR